MHLMRRLVFVVCYFHFPRIGSSYSGMQNAAADSRFSLSILPQTPSHAELSPAFDPAALAFWFLAGGLATASRRTFASGIKKF